MKKLLLIGIFSVLSVCAAQNTANFLGNNDSIKTIFELPEELSIGDEFVVTIKTRILGSVKDVELKWSIRGVIIIAFPSDVTNKNGDFSWNVDSPTEREYKIPIQCMATSEKFLCCGRVTALVVNCLPETIRDKPVPKKLRASIQCLKKEQFTDKWSKSVITIYNDNDRVLNKIRFKVAQKGFLLSQGKREKRFKESLVIRLDNPLPPGYTRSFDVFNKPIDPKNTGVHKIRVLVRAEKKLKWKGWCQTTWKERPLVGSVELTCSKRADIAYGKDSSNKVTIYNKSTKKITNIVLNFSSEAPFEFGLPNSDYKVEAWVKDRIILSVGDIAANSSKEIVIRSRPQMRKVNDFYWQSFVKKGHHLMTVKMQSAEGVSDTAQCVTDWRAVTGVTQTLIDVEDPFKVNGFNDYVYTIRNQGSAAATEVKITGIFPEEVEPRSTTGYGNQITKDTVMINNMSEYRDVVKFSLIPVLKPGEEKKFSVRVQAVKAGDARVIFRVQYKEFGKFIESNEGTIVTEK